jgi:hypothetical protein
MNKTPDADRADWERDLPAKLEAFAGIWGSFQSTEQSGAQQFLHSLLDIYGATFLPGTIFEQHPVRVPAYGKEGGQASLFPGQKAPKYTAERMDMYLPKVCVWEMKAPSEKHLGQHHDQLLRYWSRVRTRYMVLCNFHEFWIYDTDEEEGHLTPKLTFTLQELASRGDALLFLRGEMPDLARRSERITAEVASMLGQIVYDLANDPKDLRRDRDRIAKFMLECVFSMFAEDTDLVPPRLFTDAMATAKQTGRMDGVWSLFDDFGRKDPADKANRFVPYVNGPLFDLTHPKLSIGLTHIEEIYAAAKNFDWKDVRPEIFGSIFEKALHMAERHELGAHFTREADIARIVGPTIVEPWQRRIDAIGTVKHAERVIEEMKAFHVLDPASGCGNFLYVVYREMKRLEAALVMRWMVVQRLKAKRKADIRPAPPGPYFTILQLHGIELNGFAASLSRVVLWIGEHLANRELGLEDDTLPLKNLDKNVLQADALLIDWPRPEGELSIVGNPPYLGVRKLRQERGDKYAENIFERFPDNRAADYVTYWFTSALKILKPDERAGFVCTNSIAQNESREASIDRVIAQGGVITDAWKSYPWPGEAAVHIAIVNWVMAPYDGVRMLDGREVLSISPGLTEAVDVTIARPIPRNDGICFMGVTPGNTGFFLTDEQRQEIISADAESAKVIAPFLIGRDVNREIDQSPTRWIIDFGTMTKEEAEKFQGAMRHVRKYVYPVQSKNRRESRAKSWWRFAEAAPNLRLALEGRKKVLVMPRVTPHLIVSLQSTDICFDGQLMVVALSGFYELGLLQSRIHETWAWARGSTLKGDLRYTNTTIFETFPFPEHPNGLYDPRQRPSNWETERLSKIAEGFDKLRRKTCKERELGLTKIHNLLQAGELPDLQKAYEEMNDAVTACYGFPVGTWRDERETLRLLLELNRRLTDKAPG